MAMAAAREGDMSTGGDGVVYEEMLYVAIVQCHRFSGSLAKNVLQAGETHLSIVQQEQKQGLTPDNAIK